MDLETLLTLTAGGLKARADLIEMQERMSDATRTGLAETLAGRVAVGMGQAIAGPHCVSLSAVDMLRRRSLIEAFRNLCGILLLYGVAESEIVAVLEQRRDG